MSTEAAVTSDAVIYLPGIMGSELVNADGKVVWGASAGPLFRQLFFRDALDRLIPTPGDGIRATRPIQAPAMIPFLSAMEPYTNLEHRLGQAALAPEAVVAYPYDWRHSVADAAAGLVPFARAHLQQWRKQFGTIDPGKRKGLAEPKLTLVAHSMGGLVATWFATHFQDEGASEVRRIVTLGTPFRGSLDAVRVISTGKKLPFGLYADSLRKAARTMPGLYDLIARYRSVDESGVAQPRALTPSDIANIGGSAELATEAFDRMNGLMTKVDELPQETLHCLVGSAQPTLQSVKIDAGVPEFAEETTDSDGYRADFGGDGTVFRYSAAPAGIEALALPQSHGALAKTDEGTNFAMDKATERKVGAFLAPGDLGVRAPDLALAGQRFVVGATVSGESAAVSCRIEEAATDLPVNVLSEAVVGGTADFQVEIPNPGLYRLAVGAGGFGAVERLVMVVEPA